MKKMMSLLLTVVLLVSMLPVSAMAAYDATKPACQEPGHEKFDGINHDRPQSCWVKGHFNCDGMNHDKAPCGVWGHYNCDGREHLPASCGAEGHYACNKTQKHGQAACGTAGHCITDGKNHTPAVCGQAGHYKCDGLTHKVLACGHYDCDGQQHGKAVCGAKGHYACDGVQHELAACGKLGHCATDGKDHLGSPCGYPGHVGCDGRNHKLAACGVEGHYACEVRAHQHKPMSKYCNAVPQHMVCQGDQQHVCDLNQGGCGDTYLCSNSNAHTACRMCGLLWCDYALGGHETPCNNANHRPCVYTLDGKKYVKAEHQECYWCGDAKCDGEAHGDHICVKTCKACGKSKRYNMSHRMECGHYGCVPSREIHERCPIEGCGKWICDEHSHRMHGKHHEPHGRHNPRKP